MGREQTIPQAMRGAAAGLVAVLMAGCGGGGGNEDLQVSFSYSHSSQFELLTTPAGPSLTGLQGRAPTCNLISGTLPAGVQLASDCSFQGQATVTGTFGGTVRLTVSGYRGELQASYGFEVVAPQLLASDQPDHLALTIDRPLGGTPTTSLVARVIYYNQRQPGDEVELTVTRGALPAGVSLQLGESSLITAVGTPTVLGRYDIELVFVLRRSGHTVQTAPLPLTLEVVQPPLEVSYEGCCEPELGVALSFVPSSSFVPAAGASLLYELSYGTLPPGLTLDPGTGEIHGIPELEGEHGTGFTIRTTMDTPTGSTTVDNVLYLVPRGVYGLYPRSSQGYSAMYNAGTEPPLQVQHRVDTGVPFTIAPGTHHGAREGDAYRYALVPNRNHGDPVPDWVSIDPLTGVISGTKPGASAYGSFEVLITVTRGGVDYEARQYWTIN